MPKIDIKLASNRLGSGSGGGSLDPVLVSPRGGISASGQVNASFSAPQVKQNAAKVSYTPLNPNDIVTYKGIEAVGHTAEVLAESAFRFQQRQDKADADSLVLSYQQALLEGELGYTDQDGKEVKGYLYKEAGEATDSFDSHSQRIDAMYNELVQSVPQNVRREAVLRLNRERMAAQERAAAHKARQFKIKEELLEYDKKKQATLAAQKYGPSYFRDGRFAAHLDEGKFDNPEERDIAAWEVIRTTMYETFNEATRDPDMTPEQALLAAEIVFKAAEPFLEGTPHHATADHWLLERADEIKRTKASEAKRALKEIQKRSEQVLPQALGEWVKAGDGENLIATVNQFWQRFPETTEVEKESKLIKAFQESYLTLAKDLDGANTERQLSRISSMHEHIMALARTKLPGAVVQQLDDWVDAEDGLASELYKAQTVKDNRRFDAMVVELSQFKDKGVPPFAPSPLDMDPRKKAQWEEFQLNFARQYVDGLSDEEVMEHKAQQVVWKGKQILNPLTDAELDRARAMVAQGRYGIKDYMALLIKNRQLKDPTRDKAAWEKHPQYEYGLDMIDKYAKSGLFFGDIGKPEDIPDDKKDAESYMAHMEKATNSAHAAAISFNEYVAKQHAIDPSGISFTDWWRSYLESLHNTFLTVQDDRRLNKALYRTAKRVERSKLPEDNTVYGP